LSRDDKDGFIVLRLGDFGMCIGGGGHLDVIAEGSTHLVCGLPIARKGDHLSGGGEITSGSSVAEDDGGTFSLPKNIKIGGDGPFQNKVVRDLFFLSTTVTGRKILERLKGGEQVTIVSGAAPATGPDTGFATREENLAHWDEKKTSCTIQYNPDMNDLYVDGGNGEWIPCPPQLSLAHELIHAMRLCQGLATKRDTCEEGCVIGPPYPKEDPIVSNPPKAVTLGAQTFRSVPKKPCNMSKDDPTENALRKELGPEYKQRVTYAHKFMPEKPVKNLRPGECSGC
jgi:hypothetical protein